MADYGPRGSLVGSRGCGPTPRSAKCSQTARSKRPDDDAGRQAQRQDGEARKHTSRRSRCAFPTVSSSASRLWSGLAKRMSSSRADDDWSSDELLPGQERAVEAVDVVEQTLDRVALVDRRP